MKRISFNRQEWSGAFGDLGTDLPLVIGILLATPLHPAGVLIVFGLMQVLTGFFYRLPMPVQPLKAVALIVLTQHTPPDIITGGGLAIGVVMLLITATGLLDVLGRVIPKAVVRGIQFGLGLSLSIVALRDYVPAEGTPGYFLAGVCLTIVLVLMNHRRYPPALIVIGVGILYAGVFAIQWSGTLEISISHPTLVIPTADAIWTGFVLLALPQIPLSLGNSIYATHQIVADYFPERRVGVRKIGFTYSLMNIVSSVLGGIPVCHGSGGMAGHYAFGGRTGGSVILYGLMFLLAGLFCGSHFSGLLVLFPKPVLGVILLFEGMALIRLMDDLADDRREWFIAILVGVMAATLPYGFLVGMILGIALYWSYRSFGDRR